MNKVLWPLLLAALTNAQAENVLGRTTPFSKSQACQQVRCKLLSETRVGPYVVYTYTGRTGDPLQKENPEYLGKYFAIKRNEINVALGIYYRNGGGAATEYDEQFEAIEGMTVSRLLGFPTPDLKRFIAKDGSFVKLFSVPLNSTLLLTNDNAVWHSSKAKQAEVVSGELAPISVVYAVQKPEAKAVAALLNRSDPEGKERAIADFKKLFGAVGECTVKDGNVIGYKDAHGRPIKVDQQVFDKMKKWEDDAEKRGMVWAIGLDTGQLTVPGLSASIIRPMFYVSQVKNSPERFKQQLCLK